MWQPRREAALPACPPKNIPSLLLAQRAPGGTGEGAGRVFGGAPRAWHRPAERSLVQLAMRDGARDCEARPHPPLTSKGSGSLGSARDPTTSPSCTWLFISPSCCLTCKEEERRGWLGYTPPSTALHRELGSSLGSLCASTQGEMARSCWDGAGGETELPAHCALSTPASQGYHPGL